MKFTLIALAVIITSLPVFAQTASQMEEQFCSDRQDPNFVKELTKDSSNLFAFRNQGGLLNGGVCWWHSRFQRNALYLTIYKPELAKPDSLTAQKLISEIRLAKKVVIIPGFNNFLEFSSTFATEIQRELEYWQKLDGFVKFAWVDGLEGDSEVSPAKLKDLMDQIYVDVEINKNISYNKLQIPGIDAHAWLVLHMQKVNDGYDLEILDSNVANQTEIYHYHEGDIKFNYHNYFTFVPYLEKVNELEKIKKVIAKQCRN